MNIKQLMLEYLQEEGFKTECDDSDITFRYQGCTFVFFDNSNDNTFFQLAMLGIFESTPEAREKVLEACNTVTLGRKVAKCCLTDDNEVNLYFEILVDSSPEISDIVPRALSMLVQARTAFYEEMEKQQKLD